MFYFSISDSPSEVRQAEMLKKSNRIGKKFIIINQDGFIGFRKLIMESYILPNFIFIDH